MEQSTKRSAQEFAANYKVITKDGFYGPVTVGNIVPHNGKILINLNVKTLKSGDRGAVHSQPQSWYEKKAFPYATGDQVNIVVKNGYVDKISLAKAEVLGSTYAKSASIDAPVDTTKDKSALEQLEAKEDETKDEAF